jgi:hypothetical protein
VKIESKIKREGGTHVPMGATTYHFAPLADGAHVATVENEQHQDRFLSISEGFRVYRGDLKPAPVAATASELGVNLEPKFDQEPDAGAPVHDALYGSNVHPASFDIHGKIYSLGYVVAAAHTASGLSVEEWNLLADESRADLIDEALETINAAGPVINPADTNGDGLVDNAEERAALAVQYEAKFGKKPHYNLGVVKLREKLAG